MRVFCTALFFSLFFAVPARAQSSGATWEFGVGPEVVYRESSSSTHFGGGVTLARRYERFALVLEGSGTRRQGHNDWRVVGGPRLIFGGDERSSYFAQVLGGTLIRQNSSGWAVLPGVGVDVRAGSHAVRLQIDAPIERSQAQTTTSVRWSVWFMF
jgi:hypothetical protein